MAKFTTKTTEPSGRYRSFDKSYTEIKYNGVCCGTIDSDLPYTIKLMVYKDNPETSKNPNCPWTRIKLMNEFNSLNEAKTYLKTNSDKIYQLIENGGFKLYITN